MDESYIHKHYHRNNDSLWDPSNNCDVHHLEAKAKGQRYCFACAIQGPNPCAEEGSDNVDDKAGLVKGTVWAFSPQKSSAYRQLSQSVQWQQFGTLVEDTASSKSKGAKPHHT